MTNDDRIALHWYDGRGRLAETALTLDQAAAIQRGDRPVVIGHGRTQRWSARELGAQRSLAEQRLAQVDAERAAIVEQLDQQFLRAAGIDPRSWRWLI